MKDNTTSSHSHLPLKDVLVLEFCQYLSGPSAGLRLADLGARVIKIENPGKGDLCRILPIKNQWVGDNSLLFHTINRNKESYTANLKDPNELAEVHELIQQADVVMHNFRPGVMDKLGLGYKALKELNPKLIYAEISGYGSQGPWVKKPGQDLLVQAMSGLMYASGNQKDAPAPFGLAIADMLCGAQVVQGILAALVHRNKTGQGTLVELSLLESLLDFQFELLTTFFASGERPLRSKVQNAHPLLGAPYGIYPTQDGHIAIAMMAIADLQEALECTALEGFTQEMVFTHRDHIKSILVEHLAVGTTAYWLEKLRGKGLWAMDVKDWKQLKQEAGYMQMQLEQEVKLPDGSSIRTNRCPIRIDGQRLLSSRPAPELGIDRKKIKKAFNLFNSNP